MINTEGFGKVFLGKIEFDEDLEFVSRCGNRRGSETCQWKRARHRRCDEREACATG
jgi:hypothetical protein